MNEDSNFKSFNREAENLWGDSNWSDKNEEIKIKERETIKVELNENEKVLAMEIAKSGIILATDQGRVLIIKKEKTIEVGTLKNVFSKEKLKFVKANKEGNLIVTGGENRAFFIFDLTNIEEWKDIEKDKISKRLKAVVKGHFGYIYNCHWSLKNSDIFYTISDDQTVKEWSIQKVLSNSQWYPQSHKSFLTKSKNKKKGNRNKH